MAKFTIACIALLFLAVSINKAHGYTSPYILRVNDYSFVRY